MRHELAPMFTPFRLKMITELMNTNAKELISKIRRDYVVKKKDVNLKVSHLLTFVFNICLTKFLISLHVTTDFIQYISKITSVNPIGAN